MPYIIIIYLVIAYFVGWWPFDDTDRAVENSNFNVYFYYPSDQEEFLGQANGLSSCQATASSFAYQKNLIDSNWSYICCRITSDSSCATKHR